MIKERLIRIFYGVFAVCFSLVFISVLFKNPSFKPQWLIPSVIAVLVILSLIYCIIAKYETALDNHYYKILICFAVVMLAVEIITGIILRYDPMWDVGAVQKGAAEWADTGTFESYYPYFSGFPNNLGGMAFLTVFFKIASVFGIRDYYAVGVVVTSLMSSITIVLVSLICRSLTNTRNALFALVLFAVSAQYWFLGGAVYTDALTIIFPALVFWLYLISKKQFGAKRIVTYLLMGFTAAIGSLVKFTVLIMLIAIVVDICFNYKPKEILKAGVCFVGVVAVIMLSFNAYIYSNHLDRSVMKRESRPYMHWVMMGLNGSGRYNPSDYEFTDSIKDPVRKRKAVTEETFKRVKKLGISGIYNLAVKKSAIDFGDGTYGSTDFFWISPQNETKLHDWVIESEKHYKKYGTYTTAVQTVVILFMLIGAFMAILKKNEYSKKMFPLYLSVFGIWLFLMCWETNRRYFVNFAPIILICGIVSIDNILLKTKYISQNKPLKN